MTRKKSDRPAKAEAARRAAAGHQAFDRDAAREAIVAAALPHVPFDGWTAEVLRQAAREAGLDPLTPLRVFPGGPLEAIAAWVEMCDRRMLAALEKHGIRGLKVHERVALAVRLRLEALAGHREAVRRALAVLALPLNAPTATSMLWGTADAIWYAAGDTATDFNFYTKRGLLAGVYSATLLYWLEDRSEGLAGTWSFLDRRIADAMRIPRGLGRLREGLGHLPNPFRFWAPR